MTDAAEKLVAFVVFKLDEGKALLATLERLKKLKAVALGLKELS